MFRSTLMASALAALAAASYLGTSRTVKAAGYDETDLVVNKKPLTDKNGIVHPCFGPGCAAINPAALVDPHLVNSWGLASTPTSQFWVSDNGTGLATTYNVSNAAPLTPHLGTRVVNIPSPGDPLGASGTPTGVAWNPATGAGEFKIPGYLFPSCNFTTAAAAFLWATEDGTIVGWNPNLYPTVELCQAAPPPNPPAAGGNTNVNGIIAVDNSARGQGGGGGVGTGKGKGNGLGAVYKGIAIPIPISAGAATFLYVTNFRAGRVEKYDGAFNLVDTFTDRKLPKNYAPFNVVLINGKLFVTFAVQNAAKHDDVAGQGHGIVDTFDLTGDVLQRFAQHGQLDSPWGVALTPANFGELGDTLWIGNFGNGQINAYHPDSGRFISKVRDPKGRAIVIDGLWALTFGSGLGNGGSSNTLYFTAGPNGETDGLFGSLNPD